MHYILTAVFSAIQNAVFIEINKIYIYARGGTILAKVTIKFAVELRLVELLRCFRNYCNRLRQMCKIFQHSQTVLTLMTTVIKFQLKSVLTTVNKANNLMLLTICFYKVNKFFSVYRFDCVYFDFVW